MALNKQPYFTKLPRTVITSITNTSPPGNIVAANSGTDPSRVFNLILLGDTVLRTIEVYYSDGSNHVLVYVGDIPANAGRAAGIPAVELIQTNTIPGLQKDQNGNYFIDLPQNHSIRLRSTTAATTLQAVAKIRDFAE